MRCDTCGKFRKVSDVVGYDAGDSYFDAAFVVECRWCLSEADREFYNMPIPSKPKTVAGGQLSSIAAVRSKKASNWNHSDVLRSPKSEIKNSQQ